MKEEQLTPYKVLCDGIMDGSVQVNRFQKYFFFKLWAYCRHRHDLGSHIPVKEGLKENICQV